MGLLDWLRQNGEKRREPRVRAGDLVAYFWTGSVPESRQVRDIGVHGAFIVAPEQFYPGTLIQLALVDRTRDDPGPSGRIFVCARALERRGEGFGVEFPFMRGKERRAMKAFLADLGPEKAAGQPPEPVACEVADEAGTDDGILPPPPRVDASWILFDRPRAEDPAGLAEEYSTGSEANAPGQLPTGQGGAKPRADDNRKAGQALIEFALILPLLFLLVINVVNFGTFIYAWITVSHAARTGAEYLSQGGVVVDGLAPASLTAVQTLVQNDIQSLPNRATAQIRVCRAGDSPSCVGPGSYTAPAETAEPTSTGTITYQAGSVDVTYTYTPLIPIWNFPKLGIHATLPPTTLHRKAVMRMLN